MQFKKCAVSLTLVPGNSDKRTVILCEWKHYKKALHRDYRYTNIERQFLSLFPDSEFLICYVGKLLVVVLDNSQEDKLRIFFKGEK